MNRSRLSKVSYIGVLFALVACQAGVPPTAPVAAPPVAVVSAVPPTAAVSTKPLGEHVLAEWKVNSPAGIFIGSDSVWVPGHGDGMTTRIDPASNKVVGVVTGADAEQAPVAQGFNSLWITTGDNKLNRVDPATSQIIASIPFEDGSQDFGNGVIVTTAAVWVVQNDKAELIKVDPDTNSVVSKTPWTTLIDEANARTTVPAGKGTDFTWLQIVGDEGGGGITKGLLRIDPNSGAGLTFLPWSPDQSGDGAITVTDEAVWYGAGGHIYRINVATNQIDATYTTAPGIIHLAIGFGSVWLTNYERSLVQRLDVAP
jgi:hypothetical protein